MKVGAACLNLLFWRRVADGAWAVASNEILFPIAGLGDGRRHRRAIGPAEASQTLAAATQAALKVALDARIASGATTEWIIDLPNGNYGNLNLGGRKLPGKTILRSQNKALGAKFSGIEMSGCRNIFFQFVDVDRTIGGASSYGVRMSPANVCGIEYSRIYVGPIVAAPSGTPGWAYELHLRHRDQPGGQRSRHLQHRSHESDLRVVRQAHLYQRGDGLRDFRQRQRERRHGLRDHGLGHRNKFLRNWGPRAYYPI